MCVLVRSLPCGLDPKSPVLRHRGCSVHLWPRLEAFSCAVNETETERVYSSLYLLDDGTLQVFKLHRHDIDTT